MAMMLWASSTTQIVFLLRVGPTQYKQGSGETPDNFKAKALPEPDRAFVRVDHEIELHGTKSAFSCSVQGMRAHCSGHAGARRRNGCHVAAVRDVGSATLLVRLKAVGADDFAAVLCYENFTFGREPVGERGLFVHVARKGVGLACADNRFHYRPDRMRVFVVCGPDQHSRILPRLLLNADGPRIGSGGPCFTS